jgi:hypothetical protein
MRGSPFFASLWRYSRQCLESPPLAPALQPHDTHAACNEVGCEQEWWRSRSVSALEVQVVVVDWWAGGLVVKVVVVDCMVVNVVVVVRCEQRVLNKGCIREM